MFNPVNPELGIIPFGTNKIFTKRILNLNIPGKKLNVNKIHRGNSFFQKKKKKKKATIGHIRIIDLFPPC